ncbi:MAG: hypothetical protein RR086_02560 [Clostridia bacterium]
MKKFITFTLILVLLASCVGCLVGCDGGKIERAKVSADTDVSTPINLSIQLPYVSDNMKDNPVIPLMEELTGYHCTYTQFPAGGGAETELEGYFTSRPTTYNAVKLTKNQFNKKAILAAGIADLTDIINSPKYSVLKNSISKEAWDAVTYNGMILGIPDSASNNNIDKSIIIRKDIMYKLINPDTNKTYTEVPTTFDGFVKLLKAFKASQQDNNTALTLPSNIQMVPAIASSFGIEQMWQDVGGQLVFAAENENLPKYLSAMATLTSEGLLDGSMQTNSFSTCARKFSEGSAIATVSNFWEMATISKELSKQNKKLTDCVDFAVAFENESGAMKTWQSSGATYVTVIPNWMASTGANVIDYIQRKITNDNFTKIVAGTEGVDYAYDKITQQYYPLEGFSGKKLSADHFVTGTNDTIYNKIWTEVVIKGVDEYYFQWKATNADAFKRGVVGVTSITAFAPAFKTYSAAAAGIEDEFLKGVTRVILRSGTETADSVKNTYLSQSNKKAIDEVKSWYQGLSK